MKYVFLAGAVIFGITGISQAMDTIISEGVYKMQDSKLVFDFEYISVAFTPLPGFIRAFILSAGLFCLYLIWRKLKTLGIGSVADYILE